MNRPLTCTLLASCCMFFGSGSGWSQTAPPPSPPGRSPAAARWGNPLRRLVHLQRQSQDPEIFASRSDHAAECRTSCRRPGRCIPATSRTAAARYRSRIGARRRFSSTTRSTSRRRSTASSRSSRTPARSSGPSTPTSVLEPTPRPNSRTAGSPIGRLRRHGRAGRARRSSISAPWTRSYAVDADSGQACQGLRQRRRARHQPVEHRQQQVAALDPAAADRLQEQAVHRLGGPGLDPGGAAAGHGVRGRCPDRQAELESSTRCRRNCDPRPARPTSGPACRSIQENSILYLPVISPSPDFYRRRPHRTMPALHIRDGAQSRYR